MFHFNIVETHFKDFICFIFNCDCVQETIVDVEYAMKKLVTMWNIP
jgi:hypothetical protein